MKKVWRGLIVLVASISLAAGIGPNLAVVSAATTDSTNVAIDAKAALAIDAKTGKVLYAKNADTPLPIASMTKMISIYLVLEAIHSGKLKWTDTVTPDTAIYKVSQDRDLSNVPLRQDGRYNVRELYQASLIYSANAAMMLLGNAVAGSQPKFIDMMRAKLKSWGIDDASIVNATGLHNSALPADRYPGSAANSENTMTAKDLAQVAQHLLKDYPQVLKTTSIKSHTFRAGTSDATKMDNYDWMLKGLVSAQADLPVDGLKTGTTDEAGDCFTGTVKKDNMRIITVVMHAGGTAKTRRFDQTAKLMRAVLGQWQPLKITEKGQSVKRYGSLKVDKGKNQTVKVLANKSLTLLVPKGTTKKDVIYDYRQAKIVKKGSVEAPIKKNSEVGTLNIRVKGDNLGYVNGQNDDVVKLTASQTVEKANFFVLIFRGIGEFFSNLF